MRFVHVRKKSCSERSKPPAIGFSIPTMSPKRILGRPRVATAAVVSPCATFRWENPRKLIIRRGQGNDDRKAANKSLMTEAASVDEAIIPATVADLVRYAGGIDNVRNWNARACSPPLIVPPSSCTANAGAFIARRWSTRRSSGMWCLWAQIERSFSKSVRGASYFIRILMFAVGCSPNSA